MVGLAKNDRLQQKIAEAMTQAEIEFNATGHQRGCLRISATGRATAGPASDASSARPSSWTKAPIPDSSSPPCRRNAWEPVRSTKTSTVARGDMENRIKEQQLDLFADRTSAGTMRANQLRLYLSSAAYMLMHALRRLGLKETHLARAQCQTIRLKLLKIGAQIRLTVRNVWISMSEALSPQRGLRRRCAQPPGHSSALLKTVPIDRPKKRNRSITQAEVCLNPFRHPLQSPKNGSFTAINTTESLDRGLINIKTLRKPFRPA